MRRGECLVCHCLCICIAVIVVVALVVCYTVAAAAAAAAADAAAAAAEVLFRPSSQMPHCAAVMREHNVPRHEGVGWEGPTGSPDLRQIFGCD